MISVIIPSRNRPEELKYAIDSFNIDNKDVEVLVWVDTDDPQVNNYQELIGKNPNVRLFIKERVGYIRFHEMLNFLANEARYDWLFEFNDDAYMDNSNWFEIFNNFVNDNNFNPLEDPVVINIWGQGETPLNLFPIVSRKFINLLGHFSLYPACDDWVRTIAAQTNISYDLKGIKPKHRKYGDADTLKDETYFEVQKDRVDVKRMQNPSNDRFTRLINEDIEKIAKYNKFRLATLPSIDQGDASYLPVLIKILQISEGLVLELGSSHAGTPVIHWLCLEAKRRLITYESNPELFKIYKGFTSKYHEVVFVDDWDRVPIEDDHWGVVLVDHAPAERRKIEIKRLANIADYIIAHDTESQRDAEFQYANEVFPLFKYRYNYQRQKPYTSVMSNFVEFFL